MNLHEGEKQVNNYVFNTRALLGKGAFSEVYKAKNTLNGDVVAIKIVTVKKLRQQNLFGLLQNELQAMKMVTHPNIVQLYEVLNTQNNVYMVMEFCDSGDVGQILKEKGTIQEDQAIKILKDILRGYKELLKRGIIHRDLKPDNFFIHQGVNKLGDFGFAQLVKTRDQKITTTFIGTPLYMSPQCLKSEYYSSKCDIWSLGLSFYTMIVGVGPWKCETHIELLNCIYTKPITLPYNVLMSSEARDLIKKCLVINEEKRIGWDELYSLNIFRDIVVEPFENPIELTTSNKSDENYRYLNVEIHSEVKPEANYIDNAKVREYLFSLEKILNMVSDCMIMNAVSPFLLEKIRLVLYKEKIELLKNHHLAITDSDSLLRSAKITFDSYVNLVKMNINNNHEILDTQFEDAILVEALTPKHYEKFERLISQAVRQINHIIFNDFAASRSLSNKSYNFCTLLESLIAFYEIMKEKMKAPYSNNYLLISLETNEGKTMTSVERYLSIREKIYTLNL